MEKNKNYHEPVLLEESVRNLVTDKNGIYVDCTLGGGGHTIAILQALSKKGKVISIDRDHDAIEFVSTNFKQWIESGQLKLVKNNFENIDLVLASENITKVDGIFADLGVSSFQIENFERGFSFSQPGELDMRMDKTQTLSAKEVLNLYSEKELSNILYNYGEEPLSRRIAKEIVNYRTEKKLTEINDLVRIIEKCGGGKYVVKILARVFQAIRIEVNKELSSLQKLLEKSISFLKPKGRAAFISYHSLEDRVVKKFFVEHSKTIEHSLHKALPDKILTPELKLINKKPIMPSEVEIKINRRARSAKLRIAEKL